LSFSRRRLAYQLDAVVKLTRIIEAAPSRWAFRHLRDDWAKVEQELTVLEAWSQTHRRSH